MLPRILALGNTGPYGAFLQERWGDVTAMVKAVVAEVGIPVSCKMRLFPTTEQTVARAKELQDAGTVHATKTNDRMNPVS